MDEDRDTFQTAVEKIVHARHIYILGARSSTHLAGYLYFYMQMIFENVTLVQASAAGEIFEQLFRSGEGDVMIAFSFPRYSKDTINAARFARSRGAEIIAITDQKQSPVAQLSSAALLAPSDTLLLDEPFTGMDPETLQKAAALIRERGGGKNVLLATHDRDAIAALGWPVIQLAE